MVKAWTLLPPGLIWDLLRKVPFATKRADNITSLSLATREEIIVCQLVSCCLFRAGRRVVINLKLLIMILILILILLLVGLSLRKKKTKTAGTMTRATSKRSHTRGRACTWSPPVVLAETAQRATWREGPRRRGLVSRFLGMIQMIPQQRCYSSLRQCTFSPRELLFSQKGGNISIRRPRGAQMRLLVEALQRNMLTLKI
jgi:hypothetical protein